MNKEHYKKALDEARSELDQLLRENAEMQSRIATLRQTIGILAQLCGEGTDEPLITQWKLIDACIEVLKAAAPGESLTAGEIKKGLIRLGYDISGNSNILATIHTTLRRLVDNNRVKESIKNRKKAYRLMTMEEQMQAAMARGVPASQKKES